MSYSKLIDEEAETYVTWRYNIHVKKFKTDAVGIDVRFKHLDTVSDMDLFLRTAIHDIIQDVVPKSENMVVGVSITHPELTGPILRPFKPRDQLNADDIMDLVGEVVQSNEKFNLDDTTNWTFVIVNLPGGQGRFKRRVDLESWLQSKTGKNGSVILMPEDDALCLPRAIVTAIG